MSEIEYGTFTESKPHVMFSDRYDAVFRAVSLHRPHHQAREMVDGFVDAYCVHLLDLIRDALGGSGPEWRLLGTAVNAIERRIKDAERFGWDGGREVVETRLTERERGLEAIRVFCDFWLARRRPYVAITGTEADAMEQVKQMAIAANEPFPAVPPIARPDHEEGGNPPPSPKLHSFSDKQAALRAARHALDFYDLDWGDKPTAREQMVGEALRGLVAAEG